MLEILIILALMLLHGVFAMTEIAFVSSKAVRLEEKFKSGSRHAGLALELLKEPEDLLSTIQVGITVLAVITGVVGGATLADDISPLLAPLPVIGRYSAEISFVLVVSMLSYLSIVIGDLVPKTVAFNNPENIAASMAPSMRLLMRMTPHVVKPLSWSTKFFMRLLSMGAKSEPPVTAGELELLFELGSQHGVLESRESEILHSILRFKEVPARALMTPAGKINWINYGDSLHDIYKQVVMYDRQRYPVCHESVDAIAGIFSSKEFVDKYHRGEPFRLEDILHDPLLIASDMNALELLDRFRETRSYMAFVLDEQHHTEGIITLHDLMEQMLGDLPTDFETDEDRVFRREDGSYLIDAGLPVNELRDHISVTLEREKFANVGGFITARLKRLPKVGDKVFEQGYLFEVIDMDGIKVDKILVRELD